MTKSYAQQVGERLLRLRARLEGRIAVKVKKAEKKKDLEDKVDEANKKQF